ncbi:MAG TPA: RecQ family zinc-binding domain-containing protein, partial [Puia sp.]|nr:RecQ family zinc-binding domain-containing protein [Puia sp.]
VDEIRPVYQQLMNYLQLPTGAGEGQYFDFDLSSFVNRFDLGMSMVLNVLKVLEQEDLLTFQQQIYLPARLQFVAGKEALFEFGHDHPALEPLIQALLRNYQGILDMPVSIRERQLAHLTHQDPAAVTAAIAQLQAYHLVDYTPAKDTPQLHFFRDRPAADELYIDPVQYRTRKEQYATRIRAMLRYLRLEEECRSRYLAHYFGDKDAGDCGICDNCLRRRSAAGAKDRPSRPTPGSSGRGRR